MNHRVLHLIHSDQRRGAEVFAVELASCIENSGVFNNGICTLYRGQNQGLPVGDLPIFKLDHQRTFFGGLGIDPGLLYRLLGALKEFQPDIVVAHGSDTLKYTSCATILYRKAATIYRNIGTASIWANSSVKIGLNRLFLKRIDAVVSVSEYTRRDFISLYCLPESRVTLIPNGVDATEFEACRMSPARAEVRRELGLSPRDIVLVSVGNLSEEKGHGELLTIMDGLARSGLAIHLVIVGDGPLRPQLEQQARRLELTSRVQFLGRRDDVSRVLAGADIFVLSSRTEGMPGVLIEAGMAGLPSVAFDVGGVPEVIEHGVTGILVARGDLAGFEEALAKLCSDPDSSTRMGDAARQRCRDLFDIRKVAMEYAQLFLKMLKSAPREGNGNS